MGQCYAYLDDGKRCRRNAKRLNGLCGTCHGITVEYKRCTQPVVSGTYCGRLHKTQEEIAEHRASRSSRSRKRSSRSARTGSAWTSSGPNKGSYRTTRHRQGTARRAQRTSQGSRRPPTKKTGATPRSKRELSKAAKREAARLCAD